MRIYSYFIGIVVEVINVLEYITIPIEEYKELLIIKGKYEELKDTQFGILVEKPKIAEPFRLPEEPYKVTF